MPTTVDEAIDVLRLRYGDQYDIRMVPSVRIGGAPHCCRCTIRVRHGEFSASTETSYFEALLDALKQTLEASQ
ncbi:hypothetical protein LCGC14_0468360 [marine sediment metagenome]|uniref:Uncharacterized protein n=1 Tax=marine sediment metagenome TaxID=412755 RepID=A0A0F9SCW5_9ZZZZ